MGDRCSKICPHFMGDRCSKICASQKEVKWCFYLKNVKILRQTRVQNSSGFRQKYSIKVEKSACDKLGIMKRQVINGQIIKSKLYKL